jgi:ribosomal protein S18 acetylase RimI-like enzyme
MTYVIADLPAADIDRLEGLWRELLDHHLATAPHLAALGTARDPADSWRVRRAQYLQWLAVPSAAVLVARDADRLLGYAMIRSVNAAGSWQWGDQVGTLETLVVAGSARGTGVGQELLDVARERLAQWGAQVMTISVIAGNEGAVRFYLREGASDYLHTLIMPVRRPLPPSRRPLPDAVAGDPDRAGQLLSAAAVRFRPPVHSRTVPVTKPAAAR